MSRLEPKSKAVAGRRQGWLGPILVILAIWLAWQAACIAVVGRATPQLAVRVAPGSSTALRRAAEAEYLADRHDNAFALAQQALSRTPFDAAALRVAGLALAKTDPSADGLARADQILTLAGNWSLRDSQAQAWLVQQRIRQGDLFSAFSHADALARRRSDTWPATFALFTAGGKATNEGRDALAGRLAANPNWRGPYWSQLTGSLEDADQGLVAALALRLLPTPTPLSDVELTRLYSQWVKQRRFAGLVELRRRLAGSVTPVLLADGSFSTQSPRPFGWTFAMSPGLAAEVAEDEQRQNELALRVDYDGFARGVAIGQLTLLSPGAYSLNFDQRADAGQGAPRLFWRVRCLEGPVIATAPLLARAQGTWIPSKIAFSVPDQGCPAQNIELVTQPGDRRTSIIVWLDQIVLMPKSA